MKETKMSKQYEPLMTTEFMVKFNLPDTLEEQMDINNRKHIIEIMMEDGKFKNIDELMNAELNFEDKQLIDRLNSPEFKEKLNKATEKILNTKFETGE